MKALTIARLLLFSLNAWTGGYLFRQIQQDGFTPVTVLAFVLTIVFTLFFGTLIYRSIPKGSST